MPAISLTSHQRKEKRSEAHHLDPVVLIGGDGLTPAVIRETDAALNAHGLIKVRVKTKVRKGATQSAAHHDDGRARDEGLARERAHAGQTLNHTKLSHRFRGLLAAPKAAAAKGPA